jgi:membrane-bound lytic murein transglycosylase B
MSHPPDEFDLPPRLGDALRDAYTHHIDIPRRVDDAVLSAARENFARRRRLRLMTGWGTGLAAGLAAVITLAVILHRPATPVRSVARGDVDADGRLNMVDALALARHVAAGDKLDPKWDLNGDGAIDQKDVDAIASAAVSLKQSGLTRRSLPKLEQLGLDRPVGLALASGTSRATGHVSLAKASPTKTTKDDTEARR